MEKIYGIDISTFQKNYPYKKVVDTGVKFAILRAGYLDGNTIVKDAQFENHYKAFKDLGIPMGAYWFSYAKTADDGRREAQACLQLIKDKQFEYPIFLDYESNSILTGSTKVSRTAAVMAFGNEMEKAGYYVGVYTNKSWYMNYIDGPKINKRFDWWAAYWTTTTPSWCNYGMWQQGAKNIAGVNTDYNYAYRDYPKLIKENHLNGFVDIPDKDHLPDPIPDPVPKKTVEELAKEVIDGKWGNQPERQKRLEAAGYDYTAVQNKVNEILAAKQKEANELKVGDRVEIIGIGNAQARGGGRTAYGIGYRMRILAVLNGYRFPYRVGNDSGTTGFYTREALKKI